MNLNHLKKLLLILYGIKSNDINYLDLNLDYKELNHIYN